MSKLDWFTILVIAVCVLAIGALIWNAKNLMDNNKSSDQVELSEEDSEMPYDEDDRDENYDPNVDGELDSDNAANTTSGLANGGSAIHSDSDIAREAAEADAEEARMAEREAAEEAARVNEASSSSESGRINTNTSPIDNGIASKSASSSNSSSGASRSQSARSTEGRFMVLIGSYTQMISAERMLRSVRSKGYRSAQIEKFNNGKYARVLVDRRSSLNSARDLQAELMDDGFRDIQIKEK